jgi:1,4-alpha-glucan branching enzyme
LTEDIILEMHSWRDLLEDDARILANAKVLTGWFLVLPGKKAARFANACQVIDHARRVGGNSELALSREVAHARWLRDLHQVYREYPTLYRESGENFEWIECRDSLHGVIGFARRNPECAHEFLVVANLSSHRFDDYRMGTPSETMWTEIFNSEWVNYGGTSQDAPQMIRSERVVTSGRPHSIGLRLFPNSIAIFHGLRQVA